MDAECFSVVFSQIRVYVYVFIQPMITDALLYEVRALCEFDGRDFNATDCLDRILQAMSSCIDVRCTFLISLPCFVFVLDEHF